MTANMICFCIGNKAVTDYLSFSFLAPSLVSLRPDLCCFYREIWKFFSCLNFRDDISSAHRELSSIQRTE